MLPELLLSSIDEAEAIINGLIDKLFAAHDIEPAFHRELIVMAYSDKEVRDLNDRKEKKELGSFQEFLVANK